MPKANVNQIEIEYEAIGDLSGNPLLMVMGQGGQMIKWNDDFLNLLTKRGF